jgi:hypothetical protein
LHRDNETFQVKPRLPQDAPSFAKPGDAKKQAAGRVDSSTQSIAGKNDIPDGLNCGLQNKDILIRGAEIPGCKPGMDSAPRREPERGK